MLKPSLLFGALFAIAVLTFGACSKESETRPCNPGTVFLQFVCSKALGEVNATAELEGLAGQRSSKSFNFNCPGTYSLEVKVTGYETGGKINALVNATAGDGILLKDKSVEIPLQDGCTRFDLELDASDALDAAVVMNSEDGGTLTGNDGAATTDADSTSMGVARGGSCARDEQCIDGHCVDGVCCDTACDGVCMACTNEKTGSQTGQCSATKSGVKHSKCVATEPTSCGTDGACNGAGKCSFWDSTNECSAATCSSGDYVPARKCNGAGACQAAAPSKCGEYACTGEGCKTNCSVAGDCSAGVQCIGGKCGGKRALGDACSTNSECTSPGYCVDGVCCGAKCDGKCEACSATLTGGNNGECLPVPAAKGNQADCSVQSAASCGMTGRCDGARKCELHAAGTECVGQTCSGAGYAPARKCDGAGSCLPVSVMSCGTHICAAGNCKNPCASDNDCISGNFCSNGTCTAKRDNGASCNGGGNQCASGICSSSVCCNSACSGSCNSCKSGTCSNVCQNVTVGLNNNISGHLHTAYGAVSKREIFQVGDTELQIDGYSIAYFSFDVSSIPFGYTATAATLSFIVSDCNMNAFALGNMTVEPLDYGTTFEPADALIAATATGKVVARSESDVGTISIDVLDWVNKDLTARHSNLSQYRIRFATTQNNDGRNTSCAIPNSTFIAPVVPSLSMSVRQP